MVLGGERSILLSYGDIVIFEVFCLKIIDFRRFFEFSRFCLLQLFLLPISKNRAKISKLLAELTKCNRYNFTLSLLLAGDRSTFGKR